MSDTVICRRPGADYRTLEQKRRALLLAGFRCAESKERVRLLRQALKAVRRSAVA